MVELTTTPRWDNLLQCERYSGLCCQTNLSNPQREGGDQSDDPHGTDQLSDLARWLGK